MCFSWSNLYENKNPPLLKLNKCFLFLEVVNIVFLLTKINAVGNSSFFQQYYRNLNEFQLFYNLQTSVIIEERGLHQTSSRSHLYSVSARLELTVWHMQNLQFSTFEFPRLWGHSSGSVVNWRFFRGGWRHMSYPGLYQRLFTSSGCSLSVLGSVFCCFWSS